MSGQGLCTAAGKPGYLTCSICTGRGLMREFLSLQKSEVIITRMDFITYSNHAHQICVPLEVPKQALCLMPKLCSTYLQ